MSYLMCVPLLFLTISDLINKKWPLITNRIFTFLCIGAVSIITISELPVYDEWGHKLTYKAIWFMQNFSEVFNTASFKQLFFGSIGILILFLAGGSIYLNFTEISSERKSFFPKILLFSLCSFLTLGLTMRGGFKPIPIQVSDAYFSNHNILNSASANSTFHLVSNILQNREAGEPYRFMDSQKAENILRSLYEVEKDTTVFFVNQPKPNLVLFVLEGWSADVIETLGGYKDVAPHLSKIATNGISFDSCYASGSLSDQGMGAVFSAFPSQPKTSIVTLPNKYLNLPCITKSLANQGYQTSFLFGGQLSYGNIKSYMYFNGFQKIKEEKDFDAGIYHGRLGIQDGDLFAEKLNTIQKIRPPFFVASFSLSTHSPFDFIGSRPFKWGGKEKDYINSIHYADSCIHSFMSAARNQAWYKNTLFIFISDHSHNTPKGYPFYHPEYRRIPLIFYGEVIKPEFRGFKNRIVCSQLDMVTTVLKQMQIDTKKFNWSKNLFNPYSKSFAFYCGDGFMSWLRPEGRFTWFMDRNTYDLERYKKPSSKPALVEEGKAYLQKITEDFHKY